MIAAPGDVVSGVPLAAELTDLTRQILRARYVLAREHGFGRDQPLTARARALVIVEEFERTFAQLQKRDVGRRAHIERAAVVETTGSSAPR